MYKFLQNIKKLKCVQNIPEKDIQKGSVEPEVDKKEPYSH